MSGYFPVLLKTTSTLGVLCSAYLIARLHSRRGRSTERSEVKSSSSSMDRSSSEPARNSDLFMSDPERSANSSDHVNGEPVLTDRVTSFLLRRSWNALSGLFYTQPSHRNTSSQPAFSTKDYCDMSIESYCQFYELIADLAEKAEICSAVRSNFPSAKKFKSARIKAVSQKQLEDLLASLVAYTKNDKFLDLLVSSNELPKLVSTIAPEVIKVIPTETRSDRLASNSAGTVPNHAHLPVVSSSAAFVASDDQKLSIESHPEYPMHVLFASTLANLSRHPDNCSLFQNSAVQLLLSHWASSPSLHLMLLSEKIIHNHHVLHNQSQAGDANKRHIYYPDVFRLDATRQTTDSATENYDYDIVFVNGMRGSVFFTWRQNEIALKTHNPTGANSLPAYTKCWPRDWLSHHCPNARIIGINTSLSPFIWNQICPMDKLQRALDNRAKALLPQLASAGIGQRPIIWVTHSAGGILVKELLRLSRHEHLPTGHHDSIVSDTQQATVFTRPRTSSELFVPTDNSTGNTSLPPNWYSAPDEVNDPSMLDYCDQSSAELCVSTPLFTCDTDTSQTNSPISSKQTSNTELPGLSDQTKGIIFMAAPHRGNQSLFALYRRPFRWTLTPEAIQLERDSEYLLGLHSWFNIWALRSKVKILSMVETRLTPINRFWSVLLVPEDNRDRVLGQLVQVDSDHMYISKPRDPNDPAYCQIVRFIQRLFSANLSQEDEPMDVNQPPSGQSL